MRSGALSELAESLGRPGSNYLQIVERMKLLPTRSRIHVEQVIRDATPQWRPTRAQEIANDLMSWDARKILNPKLITIGAHSTNHPILANCTSEELIHEIVDCGPLIEKHLLKPVDFFCYPNGDFNPLVTRFVEKSYKAATITRSKDLKTKLTLAGVPGEKIHANYNGANTGVFKPGERLAASRALGLPDEGKIILYVGNFLPIKNSLLLARAQGLLAKAMDTKPHLVRIGTGSQEDAVRARSEAQGSGEHLRLVGQNHRRKLHNTYGLLMSSAFRVTTKACPMSPLKQWAVASRSLPPRWAESRNSSSENWFRKATSRRWQKL